MFQCDVDVKEDLRFIFGLRALTGAVKALPRSSCDQTSERPF